jgi:hypothetical protein
MGSAPVGNGWNAADSNTIFLQNGLLGYLMGKK